MNLNAEQLAVLVRTMNQEEAEGQEKRRVPRSSHPGTLSIMLCQGPSAESGGGDREEATVRIANLSSRGIALIHSSALSPGQRFLIQLPRQIDHHVNILCTVAHCTPMGQAQYNIGAEFTGVVPAETAGAGNGRRAIAAA